MKIDIPGSKASFGKKFLRSLRKKSAEGGIKRFFELSIDPMCIVGFDGCFKDLNPVCTEMFGWTREEFLGKPWMDFVHPDDIAASRNTARALMSGKKISYIENKFICKDGKYRWLSWKATPLPDEHLIYAIGRDITEEKMDRETKKHNEDRLNSLLMLSRMTDVSEEKIRKFTLESVVRLTKSSAGYLHFVNEDNRTIELVSWSDEVLKTCTAVKESHYPLDDAGIWADCVRLRRPVIHNNYQNTPGRKGLPEGHFTIQRHMSLPVFDKERIVAIAGVGNKEEPYDEFDVSQFDLFMYNMWGILKQKKADDILKRYSMEDALTGLANRRKFDEFIDIEWRRATREKRPLSLILIDIDFFKMFNDIYGHQAGDECLKRLSLCLRGSIRRAGEIIARYGGEEFIAVLPGVEIHDSITMAETMRECVAGLNIPHTGSKNYGIVTISAGVASAVPEGNLKYTDVIEAADRAMYRAKNEGRNAVRR